MVDIFTNNDRPESYDESEVREVVTATFEVNYASGGVDSS